MKGVLKKIRPIYEKQHRKLLIIPILILVLALVQIGVQTSVTGDFVNKGISLKGGSSIIIYESFSGEEISSLEAELQNAFPLAELDIRQLSSAGKTIGIAIDADAQEEEEINTLTAKVEELTQIPASTYSVEVMGSSLGESFFTQTMIALLIAFVLMGIVVAAYFRTLVPSLAVIGAAFSDIIVTVAIFNLTGIKLSTAGIAAFLMLIGYSVDTDILLTSRMLKKKELSIMQRVYSAMRTGLTMSCTTISAVLIAFIFVKSEVVKQIMLILLIGLVVDLLMTWIQNVSILRMYLEKKEGKKN